MADVIDELVVRITGDASDLERTISKVESELSKLEKVQTGATSASKSNAKATKESAAADKEKANAAKAGASAVNSGTSSVKSNTGAVDSNMSAVQKGTRAVKSYGEKWEKAGKSAKNFGEGLDSATKPLQYASMALAAGGIASAKFAIDFEDSFASVKKTVDGTPEQLDAIKKSIIDMSTVGINGHSAIPLTTAELNELAAAGGQLGIKTETISKFTETMAMLGTATNLHGEEGAATLAKFANVTKMSQENFDRLGSSIVELGNNFATTESDIANMSMRLAGAGTQIGLKQSDILGIATALSSVGIEAEMGGSAFSKAMIAMQMASSTGFTQINSVIGKTGLSLRDLQLMASNNSKDFKALAGDLGYTSEELSSMMKSGVQLENFAKITGRTSEEFKNLFDSSPAEAIDAFIKGLQNSDQAGASAIEMLQEMGFTEVRLRDSLLRLANSEAGVTEAVTRSNQAWKENTALQKEFDAKAETTASQLAITKNNFIEAARSIGETMLPTIKDLSGDLVGFAQKLASMDDTTKKSIVNTGLTIIGLGAGAKVTTGAIKTVGNTIEGIGKIKSSKMFKGIASGIAAIPAPAKAAVVGIAALGVAAKVAYDHWYDSQYRWSKGLSEGNEKVKESLDKYKNLSDIQGQIKSLKLIIENPESSQEQVNNAKSKLEEIKELLAKEYNLVINSDNSNLDDAVEQARQISKNELQSDINEQRAKLADLRNNDSQYEQTRKEAQTNYNEAIELQLKYSEAKDKISEINTRIAKNEITEAEGYKQAAKIYSEATGSDYKVTNLSNPYEQKPEKASAVFDDISMEYGEMTRAVEKYHKQITDLDGSHAELHAVAEELANWETEIIRIAAAGKDGNGITQALQGMKDFIDVGKLDMEGYAQAAALAMNGIDSLETAWSQAANGDGAALDGVVKDYIRSMQEFGASAEETATGSALIQNGFRTIDEAAAKGQDSLNIVTTNFITNAQKLGMSSNQIIKQAGLLKSGFTDIRSAIQAGKYDEVVKHLNEIGNSLGAIPEGKHITIDSSGSIFILEEAQEAIENINNNSETKLELTATGDVSVLETTDQKLKDLVENGDVTITLNAQGNGFDIVDSNGLLRGNIEANGNIIWKSEEIPTEVPDAKGKANFELGDSPTEVPNAKGVADFTLGQYPKTIPAPSFMNVNPQAHGTQNFPGGLAMVNDQTGIADNRELIVDRGKAFIPEGRNVVLPLSKGAKVYTAAQTKAIMRGLGIPHYAEGKNNSDAFTAAKDDWTHYTKTHAVTTAQELQKWLEFQEKYKDNEKDIWDIEEQIFSLQNKLYSERVSESEKWLSHEEKYNGMSVDNYLAGIDRMKAYTAEYYAQGVISHKEYTDAIADLDEKYIDKRKEQLEEMYNISKDYISEHTYFNDWQDSGDDPLAAYNRVMERNREALAKGELTQKEYDEYAKNLGSDMFSERKEQSLSWLEEQRKYFGMTDAEYVEGLERIKTYTQEYYDKGFISRREYNEAMTELDHSMWDEALSAYDDMLQKQQDYISEMREQFQKEEQALQDSWAVADRKTDMSQVQAQLDIYAGAVTDRGQQKYKELEEQMKQLQRDEELYNLQVRNNATIEGLEADYKTLEENKKNILNDLRAADIDISGYVENLSKNISLSSGNIENLLSQMLTAFKGFKVDAPSTTYADNRVVNLSAMPLAEFAAKYMGGFR